MQQSPFRSREPLSTDEALDILMSAELEVLGRMPWSSNATFLVDLHEPDRDEPRAQGVYKPARGERSLWDFPDGIYHREIAAFALSRHLGWEIVPPTVERDGPLGIGSLQLFVPADFDEHYFTLRDDPAHQAEFRRICAFDIVANNTDRKSGHCLLGEDGRIWAIDNNLTFHAQFKLRTVIWDFAGEPLPREVADALCRLLDDELPEGVTGHIDAREQEALLERTRSLLAHARYPFDDTGHRYPWPLV